MESEHASSFPFCRRHAPAHAPRSPSAASSGPIAACGGVGFAAADIIGRQTGLVIDDPPQRQPIATPSRVTTVEFVFLF